MLPGFNGQPTCLHMWMELSTRTCSMSDARTWNREAEERDILLQEYDQDTGEKYDLLLAIIATGHSRQLPGSWRSRMMWTMLLLELEDLLSIAT